MSEILSKDFKFILYHFPLCPFSRQIRILLEEKNIFYSKILENFWEQRDNFLKLNISGKVPFLILKNDTTKKNYLIYDYKNIIDFLDENFSENNISPSDLERNLNIKKIKSFIDNNFFEDCVIHILYEKVYSWLKFKKSPDITLLLLARKNIEIYCNFFNKILEKRNFIAIDTFSYADVALLSHISVLDYLGEVNWGKYIFIKEWYLLTKSRPSFRDILYDIVQSKDNEVIKPSSTYREIDF